MRPRAWPFLTCSTTDTSTTTILIGATKALTAIKLITSHPPSKTRSTGAATRSVARFRRAQQDPVTAAAPRRLTACDPGCVKTLEAVVSGQKRIQLAALANLSCASGVISESILHPNDPQSSFHAAGP